MNSRKKSDPLGESILHSTEVVLDVLAQGGLLASIPVVGTAVQVAKGIDSVRERIFLSKVSRFFEGMEDLTEKEIDAMKRRLDDPDELEDVGGVMLMTIDKLTQMDKAKMLGRIFRAYVLGEIDYVEVRRLARAVDIAFVDDLLAFVFLRAGEVPRPEHSASLVDAGLAVTRAATVSKDGGFGRQFGLGGGDPVHLYPTPSPLGETLRQILSDMQGSQ